MALLRGMLAAVLLLAAHAGVAAERPWRMEIKPDEQARYRLFVSEGRKKGEDAGTMAVPARGGDWLGARMPGYMEPGEENEEEPAYWRLGRDAEFSVKFSNTIIGQTEISRGDYSPRDKRADGPSVLFVAKIGKNEFAPFFVAFPRNLKDVSIRFSRKDGGEAELLIEVKVPRLQSVRTARFVLRGNGPQMIETRLTKR